MVDFSVVVCFASKLSMSCLVIMLSGTAFAKGVVVNKLKRGQWRLCFLIRRPAMG